VARFLIPEFLQGRHTMKDDAVVPSQTDKAFAVLRRFARKRTLAEHCELCAAELQSTHAHLLKIENRQILCSCDPCAVLFSDHGAGHYRCIPRDTRLLQNFVLSDELWQSLMIPINLAFFYRQEAAGSVLAMYPSPAGAIESTLSFETWSEIEAQNPVLQKMEPEVETLLVNRVGTTREYYLAPIDQCYRLAGLIRLHWKGLSGGNDVWRHIAQFFIEIRGEAPTKQGAMSA
jgi:hypothetical protein